MILKKQLRGELFFILLIEILTDMCYNGDEIKNRGGADYEV